MSVELSDDVFELLAGSAEAFGCVQEEDDVGGDEAPPVPPPFPPPRDAPRARWGLGPAIRVETIVEEDVKAMADWRFNSTNHHEWAPFRRADGGDGVVVDRSWWASLAPAHRDLIEAAVRVTEAE
eukprot:CAMPEP_0198528108 /NCGR_PEP_ID=MMETSP1462-20131121/24945_1 /TAXON_ID=1333877 /ORGANISM="Brandtodinium nutriculum, Strain RCC3387" /LENGTH=124 /DNA_ID=CAMNT_0044257925 /DNA_START=1 /DNA_END=372 /DNA_ORIENTATION=+